MGKFNQMDVQIQECVEDLKKLNGLPPHNSPSNFLYGDGYFANSLKSKYSNMVYTEAEKRLEAALKARKAIIVPYCCDQHCPSKPENVLLEVPADEKARDEVLKAEWKKYYDFIDADGDEVVLVVREDDCDPSFGDLYVSDEHGDYFLFLTYINC